MAERAKRGFAVKSPDERREIASRAGKASHEKGTAHEFTVEEARVAGKKGGDLVAANRQHMSEIGRKGGKVRAARQQLKAQSLAAPAQS